MINRARKKLLTRGMAAIAILAFAGAGLAGCNFNVTNPGPVADGDLSQPGAFAAVVNGIGRQLSNAFNWISIDVAVRTRELFPTQANDYIGIYVSAFEGTADLDQLNTLWNAGQQARWMGEDAIRRFKEDMGGSFNSNPNTAKAYLWSGYANRLMGEYFCSAVFDGGAPQPGSAYLERADSDFTAAMQIGAAAGSSDVAMAARAGRASVRVDLGDWTGAVADASGVPTDFSFELPYYDTGDWRYYNAVYWDGNSGQPWRGLTVWNTFYKDYYSASGDPRTPWVDHPDQPYGSGTLAPWGQIPWLTQEKYQSASNAVKLSSGAEMRLIEAEGKLDQGDMPGGMQIIQDLRSGVGVDPWPAPADMNEAWTDLKKERGIQLWLQARRLGDQRRWAESNTPGDLDPHELGVTDPSGGPDLTNRLLCLPIPNSERESNPNVPM